MNKKISALTTCTFKCYFHREIMFGLIIKETEAFRTKQKYYTIITDNFFSVIVSVGVKILENNP